MNNTQARTNPPHLAVADVYRLLSVCYYQPEEAFLEEGVFSQLKTAMAKASPLGVFEVSAMDECFRNTGPETLMLDYSRLFLGPFEIPAKPYGSVYLDGEKIVMGDSTMQALAMYREGGFEVDGDFHEMPDHVAVELEFLYLLSFSIAHATEPEEKNRLLALKRRFLDEHLGRWIGDFAEAVRGSAETDFYRQLADMTEKFVYEEMREIAEAE